MSDVIVPLSGWGRGTWGQLGFGEGSITNGGAVGQVGSVTIVAEANAPVAGLAASTSVGSVLVAAGSNVSVTGLAATAITGEPAPFTAYNQAQLSTAQAKFGVSSLRTDGSLDRIQNDDPCVFGAGDYTVEFWTYRTVNGAGNQWLFDNRTGVNNGNLIYVDSLGRVGAVIDGGVGGSASPTAIATGAWHHIALVRNGSSYKFFVNGVAANNNFQPNTTDYSGRTYTIGSGIFSTPGAFSFNGWTDEVRISTTARYTTNFTPPASPFASDSSTEVLLHFDGVNGSTDIVNEATSNTVTIEASANVSPSGAAGAGAVGSVTITGQGNVPVSGLSATAEVGSVTVTANADVSVTGLSATGANGSVTVTGSANVDATGLAATSAVGSVTVVGVANVYTIGVAGTGQVGTVALSQSIEVYPTGVAATSALGNVTAEAGAVTPVSGFAVSGSVGSVTVTGTATVNLIGVEATGQVGSVRIWGEIVPTPGNNWNDITPSGGVWTEVAPGVANGWNAITPSGDTWTEVTPGVEPDWTDIAA